MVSVTADFSVETTQSIRQWNNIIKVLNQKKKFFLFKTKGKYFDRHTKPEIINH